jgi:hypothetical protein
MTGISKFILAIMLSATMITAATVAVLEITIADEESELTINETRFLSDEFRRQIVKTLPSSYSVLTRDQLISSISGTKDDFVYSGYIEIGKALKSDYVTYGSISNLGSLLTLTLGLYETNTGVLLGEIAKEAQDLKGLLEVIREKTPELLAKMPRDSASEVVPAATVLPNLPSESKSKTPIWVAVGLDALGVAAFGLGIYFNSKAVDSYKSYKNMEKGLQKEEYDSAYKDVKSSATGRNVFYSVGTALLLGGITVHIWF